MDIDVVIPWVDPTDKEWQASKNKFLKDLNNDKVDNSENRFRDWDNFKYVFRGIDKFMPWVHKIYLITCGQVHDRRFLRRQSHRSQLHLHPFRHAWLQVRKQLLCR